MIEEILIAFGIIFFAEMGDKSQMLAMAFASKYKIKYVIIGMFVGILLNHILAIFLGQLIGDILPLEFVSIGAGILFLMFGFWSLSIDQETEHRKMKTYGPIVAVSLAFFIGELGDKTQLAAFTLASDANYPLLILVGTVLGMMSVGMLGIYVGMKMGSKIPEELMKLISGFVFVLFGMLKLYQNIPTNIIGFPYGLMLVLVVVILFGIRMMPLVRSYQSHMPTAFKNTAEQLKVFYSDLYERLDGICLGENVCGGCDGKSCLVGYTKLMLTNAKNLEEVDLEYVKNTDHQKHFPQDKIIESLLLVIKKLEEDQDKKDNRILTQLRYNYERLLFKHHIHLFQSKEDYVNKVAYYDKNIAKQIRLNWK